LLGTKVGYSADGKRDVLKCSMYVPDICVAPSKRAYIRNKKQIGKLLWQAELGCYYCSRCLAHADGHATRIADASRRAMIGVSDEAAEAAATSRRRGALGGAQGAPSEPPGPLKPAPQGANLYERRQGLGGLSWGHPGASPSIGPQTARVRFEKK
jgi:hypothetical protein